MMKTVMNQSLLVNHADNLKLYDNAILKLEEK